MVKIIYARNFLLTLGTAVKPAMFSMYTNYLNNQNKVINIPSNTFSRSASTYRVLLFYFLLSKYSFSSRVVAVQVCITVKIKQRIKS